jgi:hypothetical protein
MSRVALLKLTDVNNTVYQLQPNPSFGKTSLFVDGITDSETVSTISVTTLDGKVLLTSSGTLSEMNTELEKMSEKLASGVYHIRVTTDTDSKVLRFVKQ